MTENLGIASSPIQIDSRKSVMTIRTGMDVSRGTAIVHAVQPPRKHLTTKSGYYELGNIIGEVTFEFVGA